MYRYSFEQLSALEFEALVVDICQDALGIAAHAFSTGPDGGRDSYFSGTASKYPSDKEPWSGNFIIQAKHTTKSEASCSDNDFFENKTSILKEEVDKIKNRMKNETVDCYIVFTNRKLSGGFHNKIKKYMSDELGINNVDIHGYEDMANFVELQRQLIDKHRLLRYLLPDRFYEQDIRNIIVLFGKNIDWVNMTPAADDDFGYIDKDKKNQLNGIDESYFKEIRDHSLMFFRDIEKFLHDPRNQQYLQMYKNTVSDLRGYLIKHEERYTFLEMLENIIESIIGIDPNQDIHKVRALARVFVHYMYWNCDIGKK